MLANFKAALAARRMRQADLALELRVSPSVLSEIVNGRRQAEPALAIRIAKIVQADQGWLFSESCTLPPFVPAAETTSQPMELATAN